MNRREAAASLIAIACTLAGRGTASAAAAAAAAVAPTPPRHRRVPQTVGNFGHKRIDNFAWMRPKDWQAVLRDPAKLDRPIAAAVEAESAYADAMLAPGAALAARLRARADELHRANSATVEIEDGGFRYAMRRSSGGRPVYVRRRVSDGAEQILLDVGAEAAGKPFFTLHWNGPVHSADGKLVGWAQDLAGSGIFQIRVRAIASGRMLVTDLDNAHGGMAFDPAGRYLYWVGRNATGTANSVWRRDMETGADLKLHAEADPAFFIELRALKSGKFVLFRMMNGAQSEAWLIPAGDPAGKPRLVAAREADLRYDVEHWNDQLIILTDADGASDQKLMTAPVETPGRANWRPLVAHQPGRFIAAIHPFRDQLVREEWRDALPRLVIMDRDGTEKDVAFDEPAYAIEVPHGQGWDARSLAFGYQSPRLPRQANQLDLVSGKVTAIQADQVSAGFDPGRYLVERIVAPAADGALIPITVLRARTAPRDGTAPLMLYGYGSYGANAEADFRPGALALVDQGWTYAIAHVRGGAERGNGWWRSVLRKGKRTTFTDFIACAEHLVAQRYTAKGRIVAHGYSAGGLLMGAVYTMRPDLWAGVIAQVPFVDPLNTMDHFQTHPLGTTALPIWGDPRIADEYDYIASYSPYDNLKPAPYPALLATGNVADERVAFFEPLKFGVKARQLSTSANPVLIKISAIGGHIFPDGSEAARAQDAMFGVFATQAVSRRWPGR